MVDYQEILRLAAQGYSQRQLAASTHRSHHTIKSVLELAEAYGIKWPLDSDITNEDLARILYPARIQPSDFVSPNFPHIHKELARSGVTLTLLWSEYCASCQNAGQTPYMYTQFCEKYRHRPCAVFGIWICPRAGL